MDPNQTQLYSQSPQPSIIRSKSILKYPPMAVTWDEPASSYAGPPSALKSLPPPQGPRKLQRKPPPKVVTFEQGYSPIPSESIEGGMSLVPGEEQPPLMPIEGIPPPVEKKQKELKKKKSFKRLFGPRGEGHDKGRPLPPLDGGVPHAQMDGIQSHMPIDLMGLHPPMDDLSHEPIHLPPQKSTSSTTHPLSKPDPGSVKELEHISFPNPHPTSSEPEPEAKEKEEPWHHYPYYFPPYTPLYPDGYPPPRELPGPEPLTTAELQAEKHSKIVGRPVVVHYPMLPPFEAYCPGEEKNKVWRTGGHNGAEWSGFGWA
ncbi:hypothetical protein L204_102120 [Cryptococcus depauperatus]|nr:hypothetical protein L204_04607 [Cryptococcus depauperatus CBS 7855]